MGFTCSKITNCQNLGVASGYFFSCLIMFRNINYCGFVNLFVCLWYELEFEC